MSTKLFNRTISLLYFLVGGMLFYVVPRANDMYSSFYSDWNTQETILIHAFHWSKYVWLLAFGSMCSFVLFLGSVLPTSYLKKLNIILSIVFVVLLFHIFDWLMGYIFCHEWGCNMLLPTWRLFE